MGLKGMFTALLCTTLLGSGASMADEYRPDEFLKLNLSKAALSPRLLAPPNRFEPVPVQDKSEPVKADLVPPQPVRTETVKAELGKAEPVVTAAPVRTAKRHVTVRTRVARRHSNPLDAQAFDTRVQVWPCKSGGICNWH